MNDRIFSRIASQVLFRVEGDHIFRKLQERVLKWAFEPSRNVRGVPDGAWEGEPFNVDRDDSEHVEAVTLEDPRYWAFRLTERLKDPGRVWTTEVGIGERTSNEAVFGCRIICAQRGPQYVPRSIPRFVRGIVFTQQPLLDGRRIAAEPWIVDGQADVNALLSFLHDPGRQHPVVILSLPENSSNPVETAIPADQFIRRTAGVVHVCVITSQASLVLTDLVGREFSVYRQAVRTYWPGFDPFSDSPTDHPLATADRIERWSNSEEWSFMEFLVHQTLRPQRRREMLERDQWPFERVRAHAAAEAHETAKRDAHSDAELLGLAYEEIEAIRRSALHEAEENKLLLADAELERKEFENDAGHAKAENFRLRAQIRRLKEEARVQGQVKEAEIPNQLDGFEDWCESNIAEDVVLLPRAFRAVRKSRYEDISMIYKALVVLRDHYVPMKRDGGRDRKKMFDDACKRLGLREQASFSGDLWGEQGKEYLVRYGQDQRPRLLDRHLKKGTDHNNERTCFRLYFFWDQEEEQVVVGWLPSHLRTRIT